MDQIFDRLAELLADEVPVVLATVIDETDESVPGAGESAVGRHLLVRRTTGDGVEVLGSLGDEGLDRVVTRDALGELSAGRSGVRHYGEHGEAREEAIT
ncbi:MAG: XdhC family protein, partial [Acidimicrobiales bacterium]|nr:XdhC family protein [Acidimicrobiales bacterium]